MHISLRPNEKIYINGAVLKVDRKVSIELLNDAVFLLEAHVMLEQSATTPLRKLYFIVQLMLMEPQGLENKRAVFNLHVVSTTASCDDASIHTGLAAVSDLVGKGRIFEALKLIRSMLPIEDAFAARLGGASQTERTSVVLAKPAAEDRPPAPTQRVAEIARRQDVA